MDYKKPKNSLPKLEDIKENTLYSLTLNPSEQFYKKRVDREQYVVSDLIKMFRKDPSTTGHVYLEISPHGRLHFHGVIGILDRYTFYRDMVPQLEDSYTIEIDTIKDEDVWKTYCMKQQEFIPRHYKAGIRLDYKSVLDYPPNIIPPCFQAQDYSVLTKGKLNA